MTVHILNLISYHALITANQLDIDANATLCNMHHYIFFAILLALKSFD